MTVAPTESAMDPAIGPAVGPALDTVPSPGLPALVVGLHDAVVGCERLRRAIATELEITPTALITLGLLASHADLTLSALARRLDLTLSAVTSVIDSLARAGYARRARHPTDRRSFLAQLTPAGRHAAAWASERFSAGVAGALRELDPDSAALEGATAILAAIGATLLGSAGRA